MSNHLKFEVRIADWARDKAALQAIRREVFVIEQKVPEHEEWDELDATCRHVLAASGDGVPIGTGRLLPDGNNVTHARIGRMAVLNSWRGYGVGHGLLLKLMEMAGENRYAEIHLHAQTHALEFYRKHGFTPLGAEFMEAGIPHYEMRIALKQRV